MKDVDHAAPSVSDLVVGGAPEGYDGKIVADLARGTGAPVLHIARDDRRAAAMADALGFWAPDLPVLRFPAWDCTPYDRISPNAEISAARMATLAALADGFSAPAVVLATANAAALRTPPRAAVESGSWSAAVGSRVDVDRWSSISSAPATTAPRPSPNPAISPCGAASSTSFRRGRRRRSGSISSATFSTARAASTSKASAR